MKRIAIITGGDATYFPLLCELFDSIARFPESREVQFCVIDAGLLPEQKEHFVRVGARVHVPGWEFAVPWRRHHGREFLRANLAKSSLDRYFPEFEILIWIDGDAWVQDWAAIALLVDTARKGSLAIVSQASRFQRYNVSLKWILLDYVKLSSILWKNARRARLPRHICRAVGNRPTLNAGIYALRRDAQHWEAWRAHQARCVRYGRLFTSDQLSLALMAYVDELPYELLPEWCNYMGPWRAETAGGRLVEYYPPYRPLGIVHLAGFNEMRRDPNVQIEIPDASGATIIRSLRYPAWKSPAPSTASANTVS